LANDIRKQQEHGILLLVICELHPELFSLLLGQQPGMRPKTSPENRDLIHTAHSCLRHTHIDLMSFAYACALNAQHG